MKRSRMNCRANPNRSNPDHWWVEGEDGKRVWTGPTSGLEWIHRFGKVDGYKQAPQYNLCWAFGEMRHQDVCAARLYPECKTCNIPSLYRYRLPVKSAFEFEAVLAGIDSRRKGAKLRRNKFRLTVQKTQRKFTLSL